MNTKIFKKIQHTQKNIKKNRDKILVMTLQRKLINRQNALTYVVLFRHAVDNFHSVSRRPFRRENIKTVS